MPDRSGLEGRPSRDRIVEAAFALFDEQGYDATTVDRIAERAGVSRSTFFRLFPSKDEVIFPDHDGLRARIEARLATGDGATSMVAVIEAARVVLEHYLEEGELARTRYRLARSVPALRDREMAEMAAYQRIFRESILRWSVPGDTAGAELRAELMGNAVVTAHNVVLRRWLRGLTDRPRDDFESAIGQVIELFGAQRADADETVVVVLRSPRNVDAVLHQVRRALDENVPPAQAEVGRQK